MGWVRVETAVRALCVVGTALSVVRRAAAGEHELEPMLVVRSCDQGHGGGGQVGGHWSDHGTTTGNQTWLKFSIPAFPGERITGVVLNIGPVTQYNHPWDAGIQVHYVADDTWTAADLASARASVGARKGNRNASDEGKTATGRVSTNVLDWLLLPGEGQGAGLSVRLSHSGGGRRGWYARKPTTLTLTTKTLMTFGPATVPAAGAGGLAVRSSLETVFAEAPPTPDSSPVVTLSAARRESESAQIIVIAGAEPKRVSAVVAGPLVAEGGRAQIPANRTRVELVGYVTVEKPSWRGWERVGLWPDVLLPMRSFVVPAGQCRLVWVTVTVPERAAAGDYRGAVTLTFGGGSDVRVPVRLHVFGFTLPASPSLRTSYWTNLKSAYDGGIARTTMARKLHDLFGAYRTSTDVWGGVRYCREGDGSVTVDFEQTRRNIVYAVEVAGFNTLNVSSGCWGGSPFGGKTPVYDRATGEPVPQGEREGLGIDLMRLYLNRVCDWLESKGWLERAYLQLWDEPKRETWGWGCGKAYPSTRTKESRLPLLCVAGVHPELQGLFDIWCPNVHFYDASTYRQAREGVRLRGHKNLAATVTASSTGGWGNAAFYMYRPTDAYDGCLYTKWVPAEAPAPGTPQWLQFELDEVRPLDGIRVVPYRQPPAPGSWRVELTADGDTFRPAGLSSRGGVEHGWSFERQDVKAVRVVFAGLPDSFEPTEAQPVRPPETWPSGVREVELLCEGTPAEAVAPRPADERPCEMWEYNVGADYPSVCIDARPIEHRATGWTMWLHESAGYLNYGGGQWQAIGFDFRELSQGESPLVWHCSGNGGPNIAWPGKEGPLASIRFARFRDGIDDHDYLSLLEDAVPGHALLRAFRAKGRATHAAPEAVGRSRAALARALEEAAPE